MSKVSSVVTSKPLLSEIIKLINSSSANVNSYTFLADIFEVGAIAISNRFDFQRASAREEKYLSIIQKYDASMREKIVDIFTRIYVLLIQQIEPTVGFDDYLGKIYMNSNTSNSQAGQFFTPYDVSKACAEIAINESMIEEYKAQDKILLLNEPTCGSGGMILAAADVLYNKYEFNISRNLCVVCGDLDLRCVHMTYLQLGLAGIPAVIFHQNALTLQTWDVWETPSLIMQYTRFKNCLKKGP